MDGPRIRHALGELLRREVAWRGPLPDGDLAEHLDSVQLLTLVVAVEDRFGVCFDADDERRARTAERLVEVIARKLAPEARSTHGP